MTSSTNQLKPVESIIRGLLLGILIASAMLLVRFLPAMDITRLGLSWFMAPYREHVPRRKLWDWLQLVGGSSILGVFVGVISFSISSSNQHQAKKLQEMQEKQAKELQRLQAESAKKLQKDKENQTLLTSYINDMTGLIERNPGYFDRPFLGDRGETKYSSKEPSKTAMISNADNANQMLFIAVGTRTLNAIDALSGSGSRQGQVLRFAVRAFPQVFCEPSLQSARLTCSLPENISLKHIVLKKFDISPRNNIPKDLFAFKDLEGADLSGSTFDGAQLLNVRFNKANLSDVKFTRNSALYGTDFSESNLNGAQFLGVDLGTAINLDKSKFNAVTLTLDVKLPGDLNSRTKLCDLIKKGRISLSPRVYVEGDTAIASPRILKPEEILNEKAQFMDRNGCKA